MHVSNRRNSRSRLVIWCIAAAMLCAQASSFFACSFNNSSPDFLPTPPPTPTPTVSISVAPTTITLGQSAVLTWSSAGVTACTASGAWSGPQNPAGSTRVTPATAGTFAYVLNCTTAPTGSIAQSATLTVTGMGMASETHHLMAGRRVARVVRTDLVASGAGTFARRTDANLEDPWGLVLADGLGAVVASRQGNTSTSYDGAGRSQPLAAPLLLRLTGAMGGSFGATGIVANSGEDFMIAAAGKSAPARLVYGGRGGSIAAWSPELRGGPLLVYGATDRAAYTALAITISSTPGASRLYAADFHDGRIDVFDGAFIRQTPTTTRFAFADPTLPPDYAPFGLAVIDGLLYVAYAQRSVSGAAVPVAGAGLGLIDVFTLDGDFVSRRVAPGGALDAPWAMVRTPDSRAVPCGRALLVANTGDGTISAFDLGTGLPLGSLADERGALIAIPGLHGLTFGNDESDQPATTLFFSAGARAALGGLYGRLDFLGPSENRGGLTAAGN